MNVAQKGKATFDITGNCCGSSLLARGDKGDCGYILESICL